jgi:hypothetical protein
MKNGSSTPLSRSTNISMPTMMAMLRTIRMKLSNVIFFSSMVG